jgi:hypothetical protein
MQACGKQNLNGYYIKMMFIFDRISVLDFEMTVCS